VTLLMRGERYLPGCLVVGAALRWHVQTRAALVCLVDDSVPAWACDMLARVYDRVPVVPRLRPHESSFPETMLSDEYRGQPRAHHEPGALVARLGDAAPARAGDLRRA